MTDITLLDGSIGQELLKRSEDQATPLWSTQVMIDHADLVEAVHLDYFRSGATVASTNTYGVLTDRLERVGMEGQVDALLHKALDAARAARTTHGGGRVAGSLGPYGASYRPDIEATADEVRALYAPNIAALDSGVDFWLIETIPSIDQARFALAAVTELATKPVWLAVTVDDDDGTNLRSGESLKALAQAISDMPEDQKPQALLINCSRPEAITDGLSDLKETGLPIGAYANGFTHISSEFLKEFPTVESLEQRADLTPEAYAWFAMKWIEQGATIVGGCCEVGPAHISELATQLKQAGHRIV